ncbi:MAG: LacI family DNA-binding transcriptional regulator [Burkholderiaceae bacterium]
MTESRKKTRATGRITLNDVAQKAGVSAMTASRALRGERRVAPELVQRVKQASEALGYVPDPAARALASSRSGHVGILIPSLTNELFVDLLEQAHAVLRGAGYQVLFGISHYDAQEEEALLREQLMQRPAGLLLTGLSQTPKAREMLKKAKIPCVYMMETTDEADMYSVGFSQEAAAMRLVEHLLQRGRKRIAFAAAQLDPRTLRRMQGWRLALEQAGLYDAKLLYSNPTPSTLRMGAQMLAHIVENDASVDAIFFCNDDLAQGALLSASGLGIAIPERLSVVGFNDLSASEHMTPPLTTIHTPRAEIGQQAAQVLLQLLKGEELTQRCFDLGFSLKIRGSS